MGEAGAWLGGGHRGARRYLSWHQYEDDTHMHTHSKLGALAWRSSTFSHDKLIFRTRRMAQRVIRLDKLAWLRAWIASDGIAWRRR